MYGFKDCRLCENYTGSSCLYDMELEAKELGVELRELVDENHCDYIEAPRDYDED